MVADPLPPDRLTEPTDFDSASETITAFLAERIEAANRDGAVVWLDEYVGSLVTALLAVDAVGRENVLGLAAEDAPRGGDVGPRTIASGLGIEYRDLPVRTVLDRFEDAIAQRISPQNGGSLAANAGERIRLSAAYYAADATDGLVLGTLDRTRWALGTVTKVGRGYGDLLPIGHLYATEVRGLADHLGVPAGSLELAPSLPSVYGGDAALSIEEVDAILCELLDRDGSIEAAARVVGVSVAAVRRVARRRAHTAHKRAVPPTPESDPDGGDFFHGIELRLE